MATIYPATLDELQQSCEQYRYRTVTLDALKTSVWKAVSEIVAHEERDLRHVLQWAEGQLDMIQHTTDDADIYNHSLEVLDRLEETIRKWR